MSSIEARRARRGRRRSRDRVARAVAVVVLFLLVFLLGIAFSRALDERPQRGDLVTDVRTLTPRPQQPPATTVTVTVTSP